MCEWVGKFLNSLIIISMVSYCWNAVRALVLETYYYIFPKFFGGRPPDPPVPPEFQRSGSHKFSMTPLIIVHWFCNSVGET